MRVTAVKLVLFVAALALVAAAPAAGGSANGAEIFHQEATFTEPVADMNPCTGEPFAGEATGHIVTTAVTTPNGQVSHLTDVITLQFEAVGASGTRYVGVQTSPVEVTEESARNGLEEVVAVGTFLVIRAGESGPSPDDFMEHEVLGAHIDLASGTTTLSFFHSFAECR
jgi:hypothetical protein